MKTGFLIAIILTLLGLYFKSPKVKGRRSERAVARQLDMDSIWKYGGKTLRNLYVPKPAGGTSEIDVLYITSKGILVLENKNYAGYIFGSENDKNWTVTLYAGKSWTGRKNVEKHQFYNPIWQNRTHIKYLKEYLGNNIRFFSIIAFSNRGDLKSIEVHSPDVAVCNHAGLSDVLKELWSSYPDILSEAEIEELYNKLQPLTNADREVKQKHVEDIHDRFNNKDICPVCGGRLVLRTAKSGANAGKQFYGCSNYPKCRFTRNL